MAKPKLTRDECTQIRAIYTNEPTKETSTTLVHLFQVTPATITRVLNGNYTSLEDYEAKRRRRAAFERKPRDPIYPQDELFMLEAIEEIERGLLFPKPNLTFQPVAEHLLAKGDLEAITVYRRTPQGIVRQRSLERTVAKLMRTVGEKSDAR